MKRDICQNLKRLKWDLSDNMLTLIHVNRSIIAHNVKYNTDYPVYRINKNNKTFYCKSFTIKNGGWVEGIANFKTPLKCGARVWLETYDDVTMHDIMAFKLIREKMNLDKGKNK